MGLDAETLYKAGGAEAAEERSELVTPHDSCTILAQETAGSVFNYLVLPSMMMLEDGGEGGWWWAGRWGCAGPGVGDLGEGVGGVFLPGVRVHGELPLGRHAAHQVLPLQRPRARLPRSGPPINGHCWTQATLGLQKGGSSFFNIPYLDLRKPAGRRF